MTDGDGTDPSARLTRHEVEVPGSPEEVWQAIATGDGHAAWMFPADIEPAEGGAMTIHREPYGAAADATVTAWEPPHRFAFAEPVPTSDGLLPRSLTTEFLVEAKDGGSCVVRVVNGFREHGEGWEDLVDGAGEGWRMSLPLLRIYLTHFAGQRAAHVDVMVDLGLPVAQRTRASAVLMQQLGLSGLSRGDAFRTPGGTPGLAGTIEDLDLGYVLLRAVEPFPGVYAISCFPMGDDAPLSVNLLARLYGAPTDVAERVHAQWKGWLLGVRPSFDE